MRKEDLIELVNYLAQTKEVQLMQKYQTQLQELVKAETPVMTGDLPKK